MKIKFDGEGANKKMVIEGNPFTSRNISNPYVYDQYINTNNLTSRSFMQKPAKIGDSEIMFKTEGIRDSPKTLRKNRKLSRICSNLIGEDEFHGRSADNSVSVDLVSQ